MVNRPDHVEELLEGVEEMEAAWHKEFDLLAAGTPFGSKRMTDQQHAEWFTEMLKRYPPEPWITPEGQTVMESPWLMALRFVEDGEKEARRYVKTFTKMLGGDNGRPDLN